MWPFARKTKVEVSSKIKNDEVIWSDSVWRSEPAYKNAGGKEYSHMKWLYTLKTYLDYNRQHNASGLTGTNKNQQQILEDALKRAIASGNAATAYVACMDVSPSLQPSWFRRWFLKPEYLYLIVETAIDQFKVAKLNVENPWAVNQGEHNKSLSELNDTQQELEKYKNNKALDAAKKVLDIMEADKKKAEKRIEELETKQENVNRKAAGADVKLKEAKELSAETNKTKEIYTKLNEELKSHILTYAEESTSLSEENATLKNENKNQKETIDLQQKIIKKSEEKIDSLSKDIENHKAHAESAEASVRSLQADLLNKRENAKNLQETIKNLTTDKSFFMQKVNAAENNITTAQKAKAQLQEELNLTKNELKNTLDRAATAKKNFDLTLAYMWRLFCKLLQYFTQQPEFTPNEMQAIINIRSQILNPDQVEDEAKKGLNQQYEQVAYPTVYNETNNGQYDAVFISSNQIPTSPNKSNSGWFSGLWSKK